MQDRMDFSSFSGEELSQTNTLELTDSDLAQVSGAMGLQHAGFPGNWGYGYGYGYGYGGDWGNWNHSGWGWGNWGRGNWGWGYGHGDRD